MQRRDILAVMLFVFLAGWPGTLASAQIVASAQDASSVNAALPEDPSPHLDAATDANILHKAVASMGPIAPIHMEAIPSDWTAQSIHARDKAIIGLRDLYSPSILATIILTAGYEQIDNSEPHYGTDRGAFGERLGATGILNASVDIFTDAVFAPVPQEDPRYCIEGAQCSAIHRTLDVTTRTILTRTDHGCTRIHKTLLLGCAVSSALAHTYYPQADRTFSRIPDTFTGSIENAAPDYFVEDFSDDALVKLHLKKRG